MVSGGRVFYFLIIIIIIMCTVFDIYTINNVTLNGAAYKKIFLCLFIEFKKMRND